MRSCVKDGEDQHGVGDLSVEPHRLVEREPPRLGPQPSENVSAHGHDDDHGVNGQDQTGTSRYPYGELKGVKRRKTSVASLFPPVVASVNCGSVDG